MTKKLSQLIITCVFSLFKYRGQGGMSNSIMSGCITGGVLGLRGKTIDIKRGGL